MTVQSFKSSGRKASKAGADRIVVFTPESSNGGSPPGKWEHAETDGAILLYRDDPSELIMVVTDEALLLKSRRNGGKSPKKGKDLLDKPRTTSRPRKGALAEDTRR